MYTASFLLGGGFFVATGSAVFFVAWFLVYLPFLVWRLPKENRLIEEAA